MNKNYILSIFISLITSYSFSQCDYSNYKTLNDTSFTPNDKIICPTIVYFKPGDTRILLERSQKALNEISTFMLIHKNYKFELGIYTQHLRRPELTQKISEQRAEVVKNYLVTTFNIDGNRIIAKGYGETDLIYPIEAFTKDKTFDDKTKMHNCNRRTVLTIIKK